MKHMERRVNEGSVAKGRVDFWDWDVPKSFKRPKTRLQQDLAFEYQDMR